MLILFIIRTYFHSESKVRTGEYFARVENLDSYVADFPFKNLGKKNDNKEPRYLGRGRRTEIFGTSSLAGWGRRTKIFGTSSLTGWGRRIENSKQIFRYFFFSFFLFCLNFIFLTNL